jgi:hypothetical protein
VKVTGFLLEYPTAPLSSIMWRIPWSEGRMDGEMVVEKKRVRVAKGARDGG